VSKNLLHMSQVVNMCTIFAPNIINKIVGFKSGDYENDDVLLCDILQMVPVFQEILHCHS
jgi:hypothetical protein